MWTKEEIEIVAKFAKTKTLREMARMTKKSESQISKYISYHGLRHEQPKILVNDVPDVTGVLMKTHHGVLYKTELGSYHTIMN